MQLICILFLSLFSLLSSFSVFPSRVSTATFTLYAEKIRVRLSSDVPGVGKKGEITLVSPSYFSNSLQPKRLATKISDEEMTRIENKDKAMMELANIIGKSIDSKDLFFIKHKMGPNGQLFGSISLKDASETVLTQLFAKEPKAKELKNLALDDIFECDQKSFVKGSKVNDLRKKGLYIVMLKLHPSLPPFQTFLNVVSDAE